MGGSLERSLAMKVHALGIDLAKNVFQPHGVDRKERCVLMRRVRRDTLMKAVAELEPWLTQGHLVKIMAPYT
jgi:hypothetical protein